MIYYTHPHTHTHTHTPHTPSPHTHTMTIIIIIIIINCIVLYCTDHILYSGICIELLMLKCYWNIEFTWYVLFCLSDGRFATVTTAAHTTGSPTGTACRTKNMIIEEKLHHILYSGICIELLILKCWWNIEFTWYILFCLSAGWLTTAASAYRNLLPSLGTFSQYDCLLLHVDISTLLLRRISQNVIKPIKWEKSISCESLSHSHSYFCCWCSCLCWCCFVVVIVIMHLRLFSSRFELGRFGRNPIMVCIIYIR